MGWSQTWSLSAGITIRTSADYELCLDLAGGSTDNGTPLMLWECNGLWEQKWVFDDWQIKLAADTSKCVDAGGLEAGNSLFLWDCNGAEQQFFGYDGTIYMSSSSADASLCVDLPGGSLDWGTQLEVYYCNECWNQYFDVIGPADDMGKVLHQPKPQLLASSKGNLTVRDCPPTGGPSPPPSGGGGAHCTDGDQDSLESSNWAGYFKAVYGAVPTWGYPICVYNFWWLYKDVKLKHGCMEYGFDPPKCPNAEGDYYLKNNMFDTTIKNSAWIYHSPPYGGLPGNTWVEVTHAEALCASGEGHGMWFFYTEGSGVWFNTGETRVFMDHGESGLALCGKFVGGFDEAIQCAQNQGINSVQYTWRHDPEWSCSILQAARGIEIVGTIGYNGDKLTGKLPCGNKSGMGVLKAGWEASQDCVCDNSKKVANCAIFPMFPPNYH